MQNGKFVPDDRIEGRIYVDFEGHPLLVREGTGAVMPNTGGLISAFNQRNPIMIGDYVVYVSKYGGVFWVADTVKGTITQKKLFRELTIDHVKSNITISPIIANICTAPDNSIIIAARPKKNAFRTYTPPKEGEYNRREISQWHFDNLLKYPEIEWWKFYPHDGTFTPIPHPEGNMPASIVDPRKLMQFRFRVHPNEKVTLAPR